MICGTVPIEFPPTPPLIIGATGGSGTRVIARIARDAGFALGTNLNEPEDALDFVPLHDAWINRYLRLVNGRPGTPVAKLPTGFREAFAEAVGRLLAGEAQQDRWGWKAPRSIYLLPLYRHVYPSLKFIHVIRDGRDMALSKNQNQLRQHASTLLTWRERFFQSRPVRSIMLWDRVNGRTAQFAEQELGSNYLQIRFEDLCNDPVGTVARLLQFVEAKGDAGKIASERIKPPGTLGRWRSAEAGLIQKLNQVADASLRRFDYL